MLNNGLVVLTGRDICLDGEDLDAVFGLKGFLGGLEFGDVAAGNYQVGALFGESDVDAVADPADPSLRVALPPPVTITVLPVNNPMS